MFNVAAIGHESSYERNARRVNFFAAPPVTPMQGVAAGGGNLVGGVNLEDKTGTSNQAATLPGGRETMMARRLDVSI